MIHIGCWRWGSKYGPEYVDRLQAALFRNVSKVFMFHVWEPRPEDRYLTEIPGCFARLRTFDPKWQKDQCIREGEKIVCLDLDLVVTGSLDGLFDRAEPFVILQGVNAKNPCPMNGSLWMLRAGYRPDVWSEFSLDLASKIVFDSFPDDQAWFWDMMPDAGAFGPEQGVYAFQKPGWPKGDALPKDARIVAFPGWRDPAKFTNLEWVRRHWLA